MQKKFSKIRFLLHLLMWTLVIMLVLPSLAYLSAFGIGVFLQDFFWFLMMSVVFTLLVYLVMLPLWILALKNSLYNQRLRNCLNLPDPHDS